MRFISAYWHVNKHLSISCGKHIWIVSRITKNRITIIRRMRVVGHTDDGHEYHGTYRLPRNVKWIQPNGELGSIETSYGPNRRREYDTTHRYSITQIKKEIRDSKIFYDPLAPYKGFHGLTIDILRENRIVAITSASKAENSGAIPLSPASNNQQVKESK